MPWPIVLQAREFALPEFLPADARWGDCPLDFERGEMLKAARAGTQLRQSALPLRNAFPEQALCVPVLPDAFVALIEKRRARMAVNQRARRGASLSSSPVVL